MIELIKKMGQKRKRPDGKGFVLVVTHGRSGSTLLQGILNRAPGWHIHGENANMLYHQYQELAAARKIKKHQKLGHHVPPETSPWFGYKNLDVQKINAQVRRRMRSFLTETAPAEARVVGFKEVRYLDVFLEDPDALTRYLDFLLKALKPCKFIMLTRDPEATSSSAWWAEEDKSKVVENLQAFSRFLEDYASSHSDDAVHVSYADVVNQTDAFWSMMSFVGAKTTRDEVAAALSMPHSYKTKAIRPFAVPKLSSAKGYSPDLINANAEWAKGNGAAARTLYQAYYDAIDPVDGRKILPAYVFRRLGLRSWPAMTSDSAKIAYFNIPKCGCTSVGNLLFLAERPDEPRPKDIHRHFRAAQHADTIDHLQDYYKFTVVRDPVKRFVSCFRNRILHHGDLKPLVDTNIIHRVPGINEFALRLEFFADQSLVMEHHVTPQSRFLNNDLSFLDRVYPIEEIAQVAKDVSKMVGRDLDMPHEQTGGPSVGLADLSEEAFDHILKYYEDDYVLLRDYYSVDAIRAEYTSARQARLALEGN